ncbi:hypothetical protein ACTHGU_07200 [Chitinophagaceae bacterium MMS25-I14]
MQNKNILNFWKWFNDNKSKLESDSYDPSFIEKLDETITEWELDWEIGPGVLKENSMTISPKGNIKLLPATEKIIEKAPAIDDWEFYPVKQPKQNWFLLELPDDNINIDAKHWEYVLLQYKDGKIEVLIKADSLSEFDKDTKEIIADIVLTNLLGEKLFMEKVDYFDIVDEFESRKGVSRLEYLPKHLQGKSFLTSK